jgi:hypothetical protein
MEKNGPAHTAPMRNVACALVTASLGLALGGCVGEPGDGHGPGSAILPLQRLDAVLAASAGKTVAWTVEAGPNASVGFELSEGRRFPIDVAAYHVESGALERIFLWPRPTAPGNAFLPGLGPVGLPAAEDPAPLRGGRFLNQTGSYRVVIGHEATVDRDLVLHFGNLTSPATRLPWDAPYAFVDASRASDLKAGVDQGPASFRHDASYEVGERVAVFMAGAVSPGTLEQELSFDGGTHAARLGPTGAEVVDRVLATRALGVRAAGTWSEGTWMLSLLPLPP